MKEIALRQVERFDRKISVYIRKRLGLPPGVSNIAFYGHSNKLLLPLTVLTEEFKIEEAVFITLRDSKGAVISNCQWFPTRLTTNVGKMIQETDIMIVLKMQIA